MSIVLKIVLYSIIGFMVAVIGVAISEYDQEERVIFAMVCFAAWPFAIFAYFILGIGLLARLAGNKLERSVSRKIRELKGRKRK